MILLKKTSCLSISARHSKNGVLIGIIWNITNPKSVSRSIDLIDTTLSIPNIKFANLAKFLSSQTDISSYYNIFNWPMLPVNQVGVLESMINPLNSVLLYYESVKELKT